MATAYFKGGATSLLINCALLAIHAIFITCISTLIIRHLEVLWLKIDKLQVRPPRKEKKRLKQRKELDSDDNDESEQKRRENDESTKIMEHTGFSPSLPECLLLQSFSDSHCASGIGALHPWTNVSGLRAGEHGSVAARPWQPSVLLGAQKDKVLSSS